MSSSVAVVTPGLSSGSARPRICKKLVIKGHASRSGASYTLFLKVQLPAIEQSETFTLLADPAVELQDAIVHRLDASGAAPALSTSAATAANSLGIPLSIDHELNDSFIDFEPSKKGQARISEGSKDTKDLPVVVGNDDGSVVLRTSVRSSPRSKLAAKSPQDRAHSYMVTLHLFVGPTSQPPSAPFSVRLPVPFCLNNFMRFTVDESMDAEPGLDGMTVEVDPPILPVSSQRKSPRKSPSAASSHRAPSIASYSDDEADVTLLGSASVDGDSDAERDDTAIVGPFQACEALEIRIAAQQAGDLNIPGPPFRILPNALRASKARCSIVYQSRETHGSRPSQAAASGQVDFEAVVQLEDPFFPGLDRDVLLHVQLDSNASVAEWQPIAVDASRGILSWSFSPIMSARSSPSQQPTTTAEGLLGKSPTFEISDLVVLPEPSQQTADEEDLLKVAPPKGINDADFDFSLDQVAATTTKQRRFSLQSSGSSRPTPSQPPSEPSEPAGTPSKMLMIAFNLLPLVQSNDPVTITIRGTLSLKDIPADIFPGQDGDRLPRGLFIPGALEQEYAQPSILPVNAALSPPRPAALQQQETMDESRETVHQQQQHDQPGLSMHSMHSGGDGKTDEILRQALAIIAAHNESLSDPKRELSIKSAQGKWTHREERGGRSDWFLRTSHLLWTLFLTAMIFVLFNAGHNANRALSVKLDELARIVEASARANAQRFPPSVDYVEEVTGVHTIAIPTTSAAPAQTSSLLDDIDLCRVDTASENDDTAEASLFWPSSVSSDHTHLQPAPAGSNLAYFVSSWLRDLLRMPVLLLRRFVSILTGA